MNETLATIAVNTYSFLLPISWLVLVIAIFAAFFTLKFMSLGF